MDEYWKRVCERDAAWEEYCKHPKKETWDLYIEALRKENEVLEGMDESE